MSRWDRVHERADVLAVAESEKAILCASPSFAGTGKVWVPKAHIHELSDVRKRGDRGILTVSWWFATKAGLVSPT